MARALDIVFDDRQIADLAAADIASWSAVDETMVALLGELAASGQRLALLSNIPEELAAHYEIHHSWLRSSRSAGSPAASATPSRTRPLSAGAWTRSPFPPIRSCSSTTAGKTSKPRKPLA